VIDQGQIFTSLCRFASERNGELSDNGPHVRPSGIRAKGLALAIYLSLAGLFNSCCVPAGIAQSKPNSASTASSRGHPANKQQDLSTANELFSKGEYYQALILLRQLKPKLLTLDYFWILQSSVFKKLDRSDQAEASLTEGLRFLPKNGELYLERSVLRKLDDRPVEAMEDLNKAIEVAPDNPRCYEERISVERRNPEPLHQIHDFDKLIALSVPPEKVKYMVRKAEYLSWMGEVRKAVQVLNQALYSAPGDQGILNLKRRYCHELERNKIECKECDDQDALKDAGLGTNTAGRNP